MGLLVKERATPDTPGTGYSVLYPKADGLWYFKDDSGVEHLIEGISSTIVNVKGDLIVATAADTVARKAAGTDGYALHAQPGASDGLQYLPPQAGFSILNGYLDWTVGSNALTVAVKTWAGGDPSGTDPVYVAFRSVTAATGLPLIRKLTTATSVTASSGSTLGTINSTAFRLWCVAFDDDGAVRLGLINCLSGTAPSLNIYPLAGWSIASSTAEGGAGAADSAAVFYTGTAVAEKAYATLGYATWEAGLVAAGTWSAGPTRKQMFGMGVPLPGQTVQTQRTQTGAVATGTTTMPLDDTIPQNTEGVEVMTQAITPRSAANLLRIEHMGYYAHSAGTSLLMGALFQDAVASALAAFKSASDTTANSCKALVLAHEMLAATTSETTFKVRAGNPNAGTVTFNGAGGAREFGGVMASHLSVTEIMA